MAVTICVHWTTGGQSRIECDDVKSTDANEDVTRARVLRRAQRRADNGEEPDEGTTIWMERNVDGFSSPVASATVNAPWSEWLDQEVGGWDSFVAACFV